jgi:hypothetical protein
MLVECEYCGRGFDGIKESAKHNHVNWCKSNPLSQQLRDVVKKRTQARIAEYDANPNVCKTCGLAIPYEKRANTFCTHSCAASFNNIGVNHHKNRDVIKHGANSDRNCEYCDNKLNKSSQIKFCNNECQGNYTWYNVTVPKISSGIYNTVDTKTLKKYLFEFRGELCELCGQGPVWNGKPLTLQIDHIDGNSDNNALSNVRVLCLHCHSQTDTFTGRNHKNTKRNSYLKRYKNRVLNMD